LPVSSVRAMRRPIVSKDFLQAAEGRFPGGKGGRDLFRVVDVGRTRRSSFPWRVIDGPGNRRMPLAAEIMKTPVRPRVSSYLDFPVRLIFAQAAVSKRIPITGLRARHRYFRRMGRTMDGAPVTKGAAATLPWRRVIIINGLPIMVKEAIPIDDRYRESRSLLRGLRHRRARGAFIMDDQGSRKNSRKRSGPSLCSRGCPTLPPERRNRPRVAEKEPRVPCFDRARDYGRTRLGN